MSSTGSTDVLYRAQPGITSAIYFILFDLVLLAILDVVLARIVCYLYYRRITAGEAVVVKSADVPALTTFLIGERATFPNILAIFVKIAVLAIILVVDLNIDSGVVTPEKSFQRSAIFSFDPSEERWTQPVTKNVVQRWERVRRCRESDRARGNITYYSISFDLLDDPIVPGGGYPDDLWIVDDSTIVCMKEGNVDLDSVMVNARISGCSQHFGNTLCSNQTRVYKYYDLDAFLRGLNYSFYKVVVGRDELAYQYWNLNSAQVESLFSEYYRPNLTCFKTRIGPSTNFQNYFGCFLVEHKDGMTLVELWRYSRRINALWRDFPGPLFEGDINIGQHAIRRSLETFWQVQDWESLSGTIVADSSHYVEFSTPVKATYFENSYTVTKISPYAIALAAVLVLLAIILRVVVAFTIQKDKRPQINSIDGLSSIAREESEPTGFSFITGHGTKIGLCHRDGHRIHFGTLKQREKCVRMDTVKNSQLPL